MIALGVAAGNRMIPVVWLGGNFLLLGMAHAIGAHRIIGKRANGSLAPWAWVLFFPLLTLTIVIWHLTRLVTREPACDVVIEGLVVGRRLLPSELCRNLDNCAFDNPNTDPMNTDFGRVTAQTAATNRFLQFQARIQF
jgi:hypothetical protein